MRDLLAHEKWVKENAEYWTTIRRRNNHNERYEWPTQQAAEQAAQRMIEADPEARFMVYAVHGVHSVWVKNIMRPT